MTCLGGTPGSEEPDVSGGCISGAGHSSFLVKEDAMIEQLPTQYHQQDTSYYCGAACAQMVLEQCGAGLLDQDDLYADNHSHSTTESNWASGPDGLTWTMNHRQSAKYFVLDALSSEDAISRMICWTIHHYQVAPIALVYGSQHWITVHGYEATTAPSSSIDAGYSIQNFIVNNPWPPTPSPGPPPPHSGGDVCGNGGTRGVLNEHISYSMWKSTYMTGVPGGYWSGRFVAVCDPDPPAPDGERSGEQEPPPFDGTAVIAPEAVRDLGVRAIERWSLRNRPGWDEALSAGDFAAPVLVHRLDRPGQSYWVLPVSVEQRLPAALAFDARYGHYLQSAALTTMDANALQLPPTVRQLPRLLHGQWVALGPDGARIRIDKDQLCLCDTYVWRPCRESLSPLWPFRLATYGGTQVYVRADGAVFGYLTTTDRGI
jgi:hypothetical protein